MTVWDACLSVHASGNGCGWDRGGTRARHDSVGCMLVSLKLNLLLGSMCQLVMCPVGDAFRNSCA